MATIREKVTQNYDLISWIIRIFVGGGINIIFINAFMDFATSKIPFINGVYYLDGLFSATVLPYFIGLSLAVLFSPLIASFTLTKRQPYLKIVPPCYISIIGCVLALVFWFQLNPESIGFAFFGGFVLVATGYAEDRAATSILGIATSRGSIYFEHLTIFADIESVLNRFCARAIRENLVLSTRVEGDSEEGYELNTQSGYSQKVKMWICKDKNEPESNTSLKITWIMKGRYNLLNSEEFVESAREYSATLKDILWSREPPLGFAVTTSFSNNVRDPIVDSVIDENSGYYAKYQRLQFKDSIKVIVIILGFVIAGILFLIEQPVYGALSALADILFSFAELPDVVRRRRRE